MISDTIILLRSPDDQEPHSLVGSSIHFVVPFKTTPLGGSAAKAALWLPLMFGQHIHGWKCPLPSKLVVFEVRPGDAARHLPGYGDPQRALRDSLMIPVIP
jgi:hypothetical protein